MKFTVLGSGSTGNAVLIATEKTRVLIDAGLSAREIFRRMAAVGEDPSKLDGVVITHEHSDHVGGLRNLLNRVGCRVFISRPTAEAYVWNRRPNGNGEAEAMSRRSMLKERAVEITSNYEFCIGDIDLETFTVPHDAADNFGFIAKHAGLRIAALTDFGHMTRLIREKLRNCDAIIIESNHSRDMLRACTVYPWSLKQRIAGRHGHFSNEDLADWLEGEFDGMARHLVLAHLSQKANDPHLARITAESALRMRMPLFQVDTEVTLTNHLEPTEWISF